MSAIGNPMIRMASHAKKGDLIEVRSRLLDVSCG